MHDVKPKSFAESLLREPRAGAAANDDASERERQHGVQASTLRVRYAGGRRIEGFPWMQYGGYEWLDGEGAERIALLFGERVLEVEGHRLELLLRDIDDMRRRHLVELSERDSNLALNTPQENEPVITRIRSYPEFGEILSEIKGEQQRETRFTKRIER